MRTTKKIIASVLALCMLGSTGTVTGFAAASGEGVGAANAYVTAVEAIDAQYTYDGNDLGATYTPQGTSFKLWSPTATKVILNRYATGSDKENGAQELGTVEMEKLKDGGGNWTGVWTCYVSGDIANTYYTYTVTAAHPKSGVLQTAETEDPYSVAVGVNGKRSMVCDLASTDPEGWDNDGHVLLDNVTENSVWEVHVKDFSWDEASGVSEANRGKYLAFTETGTTLNGEGNISTCIDYLKSLGITTVQINPFYDFQSINEAGKADQFNWGYDPQNYNVPEGSYSSNPYDGNVRINECKQMIKALHDAGLSVVMDVVYNHTYSCGTDNPLQASVPDYYFRLDSKGNFSNGSGCGNEVSSERAMTRNYIVQSCLYWVNEYHVDGFRFDLMGLMDTETMNIIRQELDNVDSRLYMWGEGWTGGSSIYPTKTCTGAEYIQTLRENCAEVDSRIAFFNDSIRNAIKGDVFEAAKKGYVTGTNTSYAQNIRFGALANTRDGSPVYVAKAPSQTVTYAACHDNRTLYDQLVLAVGNADYGNRIEKIVRMNKLAGGIVYMSQGISFILAGEEMSRTKLGDENSYISPASINKISWQNLVDYADVVSYYRGLMEIRKNFSPLTAMDKSYDGAYIFNGTASLTTSANQVAYTITNDKDGEWKKLAVIHNAAAKAINVTLKDTSCKSWVIIANDQQAGVKNLGEVTGSKLPVGAYSTTIAVDKESFDKLAVASDTGTVEVKYVYDRDGKEIADPMIITGKIGTGYQTGPSAAVPNTYMVDHVEGDAAGVFTEDTQTVKYVYTDFVPESIRLYGDINRDGSINVVDATDLQKFVAGLAPQYEAESANFDFNYDGSVNVVDATMLQKYAAGFVLSTGKYTATYTFVDADGNRQEIIKPVEKEGRVGDTYVTDEYRFLGFRLKSMPDNATGKIPYGAPVIVNYVYEQTSTDVTLHVKHGGSETYVPYLWLWGSDLSGADAGNFSPSQSWPGGPIPEGENGWYDYSFHFEGMGTYNVIVNDGSDLQTMDYKGFIENEMWIVIDDAKAENKGDYLLFYAGNPDTDPNAPVVTVG